MSPHLTADQKALLEGALEQRESQLRAQLDFHLHGQSRVERAKDVLEQDGDDAPQRRPELAVAAALTDRERAELDAVVHARDLMRVGRYGQCQACGAGIPFERLKVQPSAVQCMPCASAG